MSIGSCFGGTPLPPAGGGSKPSDREVFDAIAALLAGTRKFGDVVECRDEDVDGQVARPGNRLLIVPPEPGAVRLTPQPAPGRYLRVVPYRVVVKAQLARSQAPHPVLDRLAATIHGVLNGVEYTDYCLFDQCYVATEGQDLSEPPTYVLGLKGQFGYVVSRETGMDED